jgi:hypothetical protein
MGKRLEDHFTALDAYTEETRAGATDAWLAERAETTVQIVSKWRTLRGLPRTVVQQEPLVAIQNIAGTYNPAMHVVGSVFGGNWTAPEYVIRQPLTYTVLCRITYYAMHDLGLEPASIADGLGLREQDVQRAASAWSAHLRRRGKKCKGCTALVDPKNGPYCTRRCEDASITE